MAKKSGPAGRKRVKIDLCCQRTSARGEYCCIHGPASIHLRTDGSSSGSLFAIRPRPKDR